MDAPHRHQEDHEHHPQTPAAGLGRRRFMVRAAAVGTAAFAVPTIITMAPAGAAELTSPPPTPPPEVEVEVETKTVTLPVDPPLDPPVEVAAARPTAKPEVEVRGALALTGAPIDQLLGAGAAAVAGGGALHMWSARAARSAEAAGSVDAAPEAPDAI